MKTKANIKYFLSKCFFIKALLNDHIETRNICHFFAKTAVVFAFVLFYTSGFTQNFTPGDIAIVAINVEDSMSSYDDEFSMIGLDTIPTNMAIDITDNGWEQSNTGMWGNQEGIIRIRRTGPPLEPGEAFTLYGDGYKPDDFVVLPDSNNGSLKHWTAPMILI
ncbi:MAG: hypothetical protein K9H84_04295 [Bacteroidales bacterium]|nr:hypothetical protein [Bacteroidales bacterium]